VFNNINYDLYEQTKIGRIFTKLLNRVITDENIRLAYKNIQKNLFKFCINSNDIKNLSEEELIQTIRQKIIYYKSNIIYKTEIQKINGQIIPISISNIYDKIIQQCFKQILEPICEAKFSPHSYGFRPGRSVENAIAELYQKININDLYYVVQININDFYTNVNHSKLIRQLWTLGIQDTKFLYRLKKILQSNLQVNNSIQQLKSGIFQCGLLTATFTNIVLNELDQWIESQWNNFSTKHQYSDHGNKIRALKQTNLKEIYIIRYMDNIRIFCRNLDQAKRIKIAVIEWIQKRLKLEINEEQTQVINLNHKCDIFLGFKYKILRKNMKRVIQVYVSDENIKFIINKLKKQIIEIQHSSGNNRLLMINKYNQLVECIHNYYEIATCVNISFHKINNIINNIIINRLHVNKCGQCKSEKYKYSKQVRYLAGINIYPIGYIKFRKPLLKKFNSIYETK